MRNPISVLSAAAAILAAAPAAAQDGEAFVGAHGASVPGTYIGEGASGDWHLDLWPDQGFHLVRAPNEMHAGPWHADGRRLLLDLGGETLALEVRNAGRLRPEGAPEDGSGDLVGEGSLDPATISVPMSGMVTYFADAPTIVHCATGRTYPVIQEADYLELERAYLEDRPGPAEPLFVTLDATIATRAQMEGPDRPSVVVDDFHATWPGEDCARAAAAPGLTGTVWRLRSVGGEALAWSPPANEPFLALDGQDLRFNASVGCNTILGAYSVADGGLAFGMPASTMMACPDNLARYEARLIGALEATSDHMIGGRTLRLFDENGAITADFEAVYLQ